MVMAGACGLGLNRSYPVVHERCLQVSTRGRDIRRRKCVPEKTLAVRDDGITAVGSAERDKGTCALDGRPAIAQRDLCLAEQLDHRGDIEPVRAGLPTQPDPAAPSGRLSRGPRPDATPTSPRVLSCASMTLGSVLAAYGIENVRPYRVDAGRNNEHWYVGAGLVLRRYGPFRSDTAIDYEHTIVGQLQERGWPVAVPIPSDAGRMVVVNDGRRYSLFPRLAGRRGIPERPRQPRELGRLLGRLHRDLAAVSAAGPPDTFPRILEMPADPAWQRLDALDDPVLNGLIRRKLAEVRTAASAASGRPGVQMVHGDWHDGNILYQGGTVSGILDFDFAHPDLPLVDVAIATLIPEVEDSAQIAVGYFGARSPTEHEFDLIATAQRARGLGHVAFFIRRHVDGDHGALDQIRLGAGLLLRAEQRWPALRAAILSGTTG